MGEVSAEPSMEEILSSIKRIIAEESDPPARPRRQPSRPLPVPAPASEAVEPDEPEVLELDTPVPAPAPAPSLPSFPTPSFSAEAAMTHVSPEQAPTAATPAPSILSQQTAAASRDSLDTLSRLMTRPEPGSDGTLEGLVRDMLRPMLRDWLDMHLPGMVEQMVQREIAKITGQAS